MEEPEDLPLATLTVINRRFSVEAIIPIRQLNLWKINPIFLVHMILKLNLWK